MKASVAEVLPKLVGAVADVDGDGLTADARVQRFDAFVFERITNFRRALKCASGKRNMRDQ